MGEVYRAIDSVLERPVAVKVLAERFLLEKDLRARFEREALAGARLSRERHVVTVFDVGEHGGRPLIVMEYLDGGSVHDRLAQGGVSREQALAWLEQTAAALDSAHANGVVHRDVKPSNLLLDSDGNVRVSDFGIASTAGLDSLTLPGTVLGTPGYLSPEQARGEPATPASDRYSLGVIAFELLTGRRPFGGDTATTEAYAHVTAPVPSARAVDPGLPPAVDRVLARALAKDPGERPSSCAELVDELREALADGAHPSAEEPDGTTRLLVSQPAPATSVLARGEPPHRPGPAPPSRRVVTRSRRRPVTAAATMAVIVLSVLGVSMLVGAGREDRAGDGQANAPRRSTGTEVAESSLAKGARLDARGFELMQAGRYEEALPVLREAVLALRWSNTLDEAYASYNLAFTRFAVGRCDGVLGLLDRSERIQGSRVEIDSLRSEWEARCAPADDDEEEWSPPGQGKGKGKGKGKGGGGDD